MRSRVDIDAVDIDTPPQEAVGAVVMSGFSRVPVYQDNLDHIAGFVHIKDILLELHMGRPVVLRRLVRPGAVCPQIAALDRFCRCFAKNEPKWRSFSTNTAVPSGW